MAQIDLDSMLSKEQKEYVESIREAISKAQRLSTSTGYVVAGWGGDTYYCFVGEGKGYDGSCLFPMCINALVFDTVKEAEDHCYTGFRNGNGKGDLILLFPEKASDYFNKVHDHYERALNWALDMWEKKVGKNK